MHYGFVGKRAGRRRHGAELGKGLSLSLLLALLGCGQQYRPVVSAINPVGPAGQPTKFAIAVSSPSATNPGLLTAVDFSGDSILATPQILPNPTYLSLYGSGATAVAINAQNSLSTIPVGQPSTLLTSAVVQTALPTNPPANAPSISGFSLAGTARIMIPEAGRSAVAVLSGTSPSLQQEITVPATPVYVVGVDTTPRAYAISNSGPTTQGIVSAIEGTSLSISASIPVGNDPVYGVETADVRRAFIVNRGSGTVSVINVTNNALDSANPVIPATGTLGVNPVWADLVTTTSVLVVVNQGDGIHPGTLSIISVPLCNFTAQASNPACDANNPVDAATFGTVVGTVPVGVNPVEVSVLADGSRAYVINQGNASASIPGSLSVVNLTTATVTATIPAAATNGSPTQPATCPDGSTLTCIYGTPNTVAATTGTPTGKVYVTSGDSNYMTVIQTDRDVVDTHINLQGAGVRVRVSAP